MQFFTVSLPTKTYLKKYIHTRYGAPCTLQKNSVFTDVFLAMLLVPAPTKLGRIQLDQQLNRHNDELVIRIPIDLFYRVPKELSQHSIVRINRYFENCFNENLYDYVQLRYKNKGDRQPNIEGFCTRHGIEIEIDVTFDALKQMEYRFRTEREKYQKEFVADLSRSNSLFKKPQPLTT